MWKLLAGEKSVGSKAGWRREVSFDGNYKLQSALVMLPGTRPTDGETGHGGVQARVRDGRSASGIGKEWFLD